MKYLCLLAALLLLPVTADAQQERRGNSGRRSDRGAEQRNSANGQQPTNPNTTGLGPIGLPQMLQQNRSLPPWEQKQTPWWERQGAPAWERQQGPPAWQQPTASKGWQAAHPNAASNQPQNRPRQGNYRPGRYRYGSGYIYLVPSYGYGYPPYALPTYSENYVTPPPPAEVVTRPPEPVVPPPAPEPPPPPIGVIRLEIEPRDLIQIYVDGVYVGTPADVGSDLGLAPGVRHIELRARGYVTHAFDADIVRDRTITYRAQLERDPSAPPPPAPVVIKPASRTMYVIPGCYMGNVAPTQANLRPGCDMSKLTTIEP